MALLQDSIFSLVANGKRLLRDLESEGALAFYTPLEGGFEGRYIRRMRAAGYVAYPLSARGLGDPDAYLTGVHGVRPPHLGKKDIRTYYLPPLVQTQLDALPAGKKGLVLWILEGYVLSQQERQFLSVLPEIEPRVKVVLELGGDRALRWMPLKETLAA